VVTLAAASDPIGYLKALPYAGCAATSADINGE
jgi:hypothetical protein